MSIHTKKYIQKLLNLFDSEDKTFFKKHFLSFDYLYLVYIIVAITGPLAMFSYTIHYYLIDAIDSTILLQEYGVPIYGYLGIWFYFAVGSGLSLTATILFTVLIALFMFISYGILNLFNETFTKRILIKDEHFQSFSKDWNDLETQTIGKYFKVTSPIVLLI